MSASIDERPEWDFGRSWSRFMVGINAAHGMALNYLIDGVEDARLTVLLAHGAGAPMDSAWMQAAATALATAGLRVARFEFDYMAARRNGNRKPPPRADLLIPEYVAAVEQFDAEGPLIIGGKSMGGRVAAMVADDLHAAGKIVGLLCLGYPFHPPGRHSQLRTKHLVKIKTPTLICQGTRDAFGTRQEVAEYELSDRVEIIWLEDGDHDLRPRKRVTGATAAGHLRTVAAGVSAWADRIARLTSA